MMRPMISGVVEVPRSSASGASAAAPQVSRQGNAKVNSSRTTIPQPSWTVLDRIWIYGTAVLGGLVLGLFFGGATGAVLGGILSVALAVSHAKRARSNETEHSESISSNR